MNQSRAFITSLVFAGIGMLMVYFYISNKETSIRDRFGSDKVVVIAATDINEMSEIQPNMLSTKLVPSEFVQPDSMTDPLAFAGSVAAVPFKKGEQILRTKVLKKGADTGLASQVAISRRAVSIAVSDDTSVSKLIKPGDRVDLLANLSYDGGSEIKTILQNIHILAVGEMIQNHTPQVFENDPLTGTPRAVNIRGNRAFTTITIEVTPEEAQQVFYVQQNSGVLFMTLRNPVDRVVASVPTTTVDEVLGPNSKKAEADRKKAQPPPMMRMPTAAPAPPPKANPWAAGGGVLGK